MNNLMGILLAMLMLANVAAPIGSGKELPEYTPSDLDCSGRVQTVLVNGGEDYTLFPAEMNGDVVNDAAFARKQRVEALHNVRLESLSLPNAALFLSKAVLAGDDTIDLASLPISDAVSAASNGMLLDFGEFDSIDLGQPWWDANITDSLRLTDAEYYLLSDLSETSIGRAGCIFFDKSAIGDGVYNTVKRGGWTLDELNRLTADNTISIDGEDIPALFGAAGIPTVSASGSELAPAAVGNDMKKAADRIAALLKKAPEAESDIPLFTFSTVDQSAGFANCGILPLPKLDRFDEYYSPLDGSVQVMIMPVSNSDPDMTTVIADALAYYSTSYVSPALLDQIIEELGVSQNSPEYEMLSLIYNTRTLDPGAAYGVVPQSFDWKEAVNSGFTDRFAELENRIEQVLEKFRETLRA